jgi:hypothetical protein
MYRSFRTGRTMPSRVRVDCSLLVFERANKALVIATYTTRSMLAAWTRVCSLPFVNKNRTYTNDLSTVRTATRTVHTSNINRFVDGSLTTHHCRTCRSIFSHVDFLDRFVVEYLFLGFQLISFDYTHLELHVLAHLSNDDRLRACLTHRVDVFVALATHLWPTSDTTITDRQRQTIEQVDLVFVDVHVNRVGYEFRSSIVFDMAHV